MADNDLQQPLLASSEIEGKVSHVWEKNDTANKSFRKLGAVDDEREITITASEIRAAVVARTSDSWMHDSMISIQGKGGQATAWEKGGQFVLDEVMRSIQGPEEDELRELLFDTFGSDCCWWATKKDISWSTIKVEDCNSYIGTLETFIEERELIEEAEPYTGDAFDARDSCRVPDLWDIDMKSEMPLLFSPGKEAWKKIPNSEVVRVCEGCSGCGKVAYSNSKSKRESRHKLQQCQGIQRRIDCELCCGKGALLYSKVLVVRWKTEMVKQVCATKNAKSVPDEVFLRAKGARLYHSQSYQCEPASFPSSESLSELSASIVSGRRAIPESARIICERHQISLLPVTRVAMASRKKSLKLYILGLSKEIYAPPTRSCSLCDICTIC